MVGSCDYGVRSLPESRYFTCEGVGEVGCSVTPTHKGEPSRQKKNHAPSNCVCEYPPSKLVVAFYMHFSGGS